MNCITPGLVRTEMALGLVEFVEKSGRYPNPMHEWPTPKEIAAIALYLASGAGVTPEAKPLCSTEANSCSRKQIRTDREPLLIVHLTNIATSV